MPQNAFFLRARNLLVSQKMTQRHFFFSTLHPFSAVIFATVTVLAFVLLRNSMLLLSWCLMSSDVIWHIRDKLWPMPKHGSIRKVYACLAVTCHLHFWQNDRDFLRATVVTRGWNGYRNKSQHRKSTLEKKILPPFQQGFEPATFQSRVRRSNHWAMPAPFAILGSTSAFIHCVKQRLLTNQPGSALWPLATSFVKDYKAHSL